jgi:hypothetical protein
MLCSEAESAPAAGLGEAIQGLPLTQDNVSCQGQSPLEIPLQTGGLDPTTLAKVVAEFVQ